MSGGHDGFRVRPGRIRTSRAGRQGSFIDQVLRAATRAGHTGPGIDGTSFPGSRSTFGRGRFATGRARLFAPQRRVVVKARVVRHGTHAVRSAPMRSHLAYLNREGVTRDGGAARMFDAKADDADGGAFADRCREDRHHFRFIVSPEDAGEMTDLRAFTRDLAGRMEADLGTELEWIAADHWNTGNPHVHLLVRGIDQGGGDLVIARDYIGHGLRARAEELVSIELGPRPEHEICSVLERDVAAERWTRLDAEIRRAADGTGAIDLRPESPGPNDPEIRHLLTGRLRHLETMGLAAAAGPGEWVVRPETELSLRDLGARGDIIRTMHRALAGQGSERGIADYVIDTGAAEAPPIIGRLVARGLHDELTGEAYAVIDGTDGRAHHVRFRGVEAFEHAPPNGGIVEVRRLGGGGDGSPALVLASRSDIDLARQVTAPGATWLDHRLVERDPVPLSMGGFGREVRAAMAARTEYLAGEGLARRQGRRIVLQRDLLDTLRRRELDAAGAALSSETGLPHHPAAGGGSVAGTYRRRVTLTSGRFAMIDNGLGFQLVPWTPSLERQLGRHVSGVARDGGGIDWAFGRRRGLGL